MRLTTLLAVFVLILAACQPQSNQPEPTPLPTSTPSVTPVPLTIDLSGISPRNFRVTYNDPFTGQFATLSGEAHYTAIANLKTGYLMSFKANDSDVRIEFAIPQDIQPGTYYLNNYDASFAADNRSVQTLGATIVIANFFALTEGVMTISTVAPLTGAFKFAGVAELDETPKTATIQIEGAFNAIPALGPQS